MTEENFNKAPGSEFSKSKSSVVTMSNVKPNTSFPVQERMQNSLVNQDYPYTILQYGHLFPTLFQPGFSMYHPPPPPVPVTIPVFYQPVNGTIPQPQTFESNMYYRCLPQLPMNLDVFGQNNNWNKFNSKNLLSKPKNKDHIIDCSKSGTAISDTLGHHATALLNSDLKGEVRSGCSDVVADHEKLLTLTEMAMHGCELAEQLANNHHKRPCFKKIDSLCARMKQDLIRPDSVLANINSQGIAWAVKDFIFVFTRIINAWIIIKGYVYNTPEGLERVQKVLNPEFLDHFLKWQDSTIDFVESLIKSFTSLDLMVQTQRTSGVQKDSSFKVDATRQSKTDEEKERNIQELFEYLKDIVPNLAEVKANTSSDNASTSSLSDRSSIVYENAKNHLSPVINNSEQTQMKHNENGTYFKTGIYEPVKKPPGFDAGSSSSKKISFPLVDHNTASFATSTPKILKNPISQNRPDLLNSLVGSKECKAEFPTVSSHAVAELALSSQLQIDFFNDAIIRQSFDAETVAKVHFLIQKVFCINEAKYFLVSQFTKNYFPDFQKINPNFKDLRAIISKAQIGGYQTILEIVHDLRQIVQAARRYLEQKSSPLLKEAADEFERSLEDILCDKIFDCYDFSRITRSLSPITILSNQKNNSIVCAAEF